MEFLKELLGEELYSQVAAKINEHNGNEANKDKQVKVANLATGEYTSTAKYDAEVTASKNKDAKIANYEQTIADLQKAAKGNEGIQQRISQLEADNAQLKEAQEASDRKYAFDVLLMDAGVTDKDEREFLSYKYESKLKEEGKTLELDENKHIKGAEGIVESLKTMRPKAFESAGTGKLKVYGDNRLPDGGDHGETLTKESLLKKPYSERMRIYNENPEAYTTAMNS